MSKGSMTREVSLDSVTVFVKKDGAGGHAAYRVTVDRKLSLQEVRITAGGSGPTVEQITAILQELGVEPHEVHAYVRGSGMPVPTNEFAAIFLPVPDCKNRKAEPLLSEWLGYTVVTISPTKA